MLKEKNPWYAERWDEERITAIHNRALWKFDDQLARAGPYLLPALRILREPAKPPAKGKGGRPRQLFPRAAVERELTAQLIAIAPSGVTRTQAKGVAVKLLLKLFP